MTFSQYPGKMESNNDYQGETMPAPDCPRCVCTPPEETAEPKTYVSGGVSLPDLRDWQRHKVSVRTDRNLTLIHDSGEEITLPGTIIAENVKIAANPEAPTVWVDLRLMVKSAEVAPGGTVTFTGEVTQ